MTTIESPNAPTTVSSTARAYAQDELSHHGAEIALLRDLYAVRE
jgi:hypothetical protein